MHSELWNELSRFHQLSAALQVGSQFRAGNLKIEVLSLSGSVFVRLKRLELKEKASKILQKYNNHY